MRRLWYRAPELILRDEIYGPKVDMWSVGCLLVEAASGRAPFQSDSEIDHLFRVFRTIGTPTLSTWPEVVATKNFSPKFPIYEGFDFAQVTRGACVANLDDQRSLLQQAQPDRGEILQHLIQTASVLGVEGMLLVDRLVTLPPSARAGCEAALESPFFATRPLRPRELQLGRSMLHPTAELWLAGRHLRRFESPEPRRTPRLDNTPPTAQPRCRAELHQPDCPPLAIPSSLISSQMVWNILTVMVEQERSDRLVRVAAGELSIDEASRAVLIDMMIGISTALQLRDNTIHLATGVLDGFLVGQHKPPPMQELKVIAATCLKVCDVFSEQSKEYYKQENSVEYSEAATGQHIIPKQMLTCEKEFLPKVNFKLQQPTIQWFAQCYLVYARFHARDLVGRTAAFITDLMLLDWELMRYMPSLKAQCAVLLAVFLVQQELKQKQMAVKEPKPSMSERHGIDLPCWPAHGNLPSLDHWDRHVRDAACQSNLAVDATMCLQAVVRTLVDKRREWKQERLQAVETKHASLARTLAYPDSFPTSKLVWYILPNSQRGSM